MAGYKKSFAVAIFFTLAAGLLNLVSLITNHWMNVSRLRVLDPVSNLVYETQANYGLWRICVNYDTPYAAYDDGCHAFTARCKTNLGFGYFTFFGLKELGDCTGFNATRVLALIAFVLNCTGFCFLVVSYIRPRVWFGYTAASTILLSSLLGIFAMCVFVGTMYYKDGSYWIWGLHKEYSFWLFVTAWVLNLVAGIFAIRGVRGSGAGGVSSKSNVSSVSAAAATGTAIHDDKTKLSSAADGARLHQMDCVDVDNDGDPYGHRYPDLPPDQNPMSFHTHVV